MNVGNVYYVVNNYNENKFKSLLEKHLSKTASTFPSSELVEQALAAYLACKDTGVTDTALSVFQARLNTLTYVDRRSYLGNPVVGEPLEAIKAFNELMIMYNLYNLSK